MPDAMFTDPRLAVLYDAFDGERDDLGPYLDAAAEPGVRRVVDVGCGTGSLAVRLAGRGVDVVGVDPAAASLDVARSKDDRVRWVEGDASAVPAVGADLAVMSGNVAQVFLTDAGWHEALRAVHAALRPGGVLLLGARRPEARAWEGWAGSVTRDGVEQRTEVTGVALPLVSFRHVYRLADGAVLTSDSTLRFRPRRELVATLCAAAFRVERVVGHPAHPGRELLVRARRAVHRTTSLPQDGGRG